MPKPKGLDPKKSNTYKVSQIAGRYERNATKLGLSAFSSASLRSMGSRLGSTVPKRTPMDDRKRPR